MDFDDAGKTLTNDPSQTCADLCADLDGPLAQYKELVASLCPVTCGTCAGFCEDDEKPLSEWALTNPGFPQTCAEAPLCSACDNGNQGGVCLMKVDPASCPSNPNAYQPTTCTAANVAVGGMCEADGESGTDIHLDNCGGGYDMYKRVACAVSAPTPMADVVAALDERSKMVYAAACGKTSDKCKVLYAGRYFNDPSPPPSPSPSPPCSDYYAATGCAWTETLACPSTPMCSACDNGNQGGVCLMKVDPASCPSNPNAYQPTTCTAANVAVGGMCEADGESGTDIHLDNCGGGYDMYKRVACTETPPPAYAAANIGDIDVLCCCTEPPTSCYDDPTYVDPTFSLTCADWTTMDSNADGFPDCSQDDELYIANDGPASHHCNVVPTKSGSAPCEMGGYGPMTEGDKTFYYSAALMNRARQRCPVACGVPDSHCAGTPFG